MKLYLAPLEGITGWIYRNAVRECFGGFDKYFIPFIRPNQMGHLSSREKQDILPENNRYMYAVPQILTNRADDFVRTAEALKNYGYDEINLNLGCPSKTVVSKGRGAGFLADPVQLDQFLNDIFCRCRVRISIKTRIGVEDPSEFQQLLEVYNKYPVDELIIHPRVQKDFYKNIPNWDVFGKAQKSAAIPLCYNGDVKDQNGLNKITERFPGLERVMMGRGVLADPALARKLKGGKAADKDELRSFHDLVYEGYCREMSGERTVLYKMKEMWFYLAPAFTNSRVYAKKIKKAEKCRVYEAIIEELFSREALINEDE